MCAKALAPLYLPLSKAIRPQDLTRIDVPTTLVHGRHDLQVRIQAAEAAGARYGWPLHVLEDALDDPATEPPEAFLRALASARSRPSPASFPITRTAAS